MIQVMLYMLQTGAMAWITIAPVQCEAIKAHVERGHAFYVDGEQLKAVHCAKVNDFSEVYGVQMRWLREDGDE